MSLDRLLVFWRNTPQIAENIAHWEQVPARAARNTPLPPDVHPTLASALHETGIRDLYAHQAQSWELASRGGNLVVATGTASGKSLCYNLPVLDRLLRLETARALYLFPTKALAQDQLSAVRALVPRTEDGSAALLAAIYDGDTARSRRPAVRDNARLVLSNPDMLHLGVLPYHTRWADFFANLQYVVIDEMHIYRGVFGSHVSNLLRRLKRVAAFYGAAPQFILTSATIANPVELAAKLIENPVELVDEDGSARGRQHFLIYNPPVVNEELNIRRGVVQESVYLAGDLLTYGIQHIVFGRSRRAVELILRYLQELAGGEGSPEEGVRSYRSGYLPAERRAIEQGLRAGSVQAVAATNALELGIDVGGMGAVLLAGYPGSISGTWQQAGRAGRGREDSLAVLLTSANPLDQYLARHPDFFFGQRHEAARLNPDNLLILLEHIRCAAFEIPFKGGEGFGLVTGEVVAQYLQFLAQSGELTPSADQYFWTSEDYPAQNVSLRTASALRINLLVEGDQPQTIGEVDGESAPWMVHPGAVYLHQAESYFVDSLEMEEGVARLRPVTLDYYTEAKRQTEVGLLELRETDGVPGGCKSHGEVLVTTQVTGFRKIQWFTQERLGDEPLEMPPSELQTSAYWLVLSDETVGALREAGLWGADSNRYGTDWPRIRDAVRERDGYTCQVCGAPEGARAHHVHHKVPFRNFERPQDANRPENLLTLCPACHQRAETAVRVRSGLAGLSYALGNLAPLFLMCDPSDIQTHADPKSPLGDGAPTVVIYERIPAGVGFSERLYEVHGELIRAAAELVQDCSCADGCPSCVGPGGELGSGGKSETAAILGALGTNP
jgi:DEAD/DEAH box helicase domain-containing protein